MEIERETWWRESENKENAYSETANTNEIPPWNVKMAQSIKRKRKITAKRFSMTGSRANCFACLHSNSMTDPREWPVNIVFKFWLNSIQCTTHEQTCDARNVWRITCCRRGLEIISLCEEEGLGKLKHEKKNKKSEIAVKLKSKFNFHYFKENSNLLSSISEGYTSSEVMVRNGARKTRRLKAGFNTTGIAIPIQNSIVIWPSRIRLVVTEVSLIPKTSPMILLLLKIAHPRMSLTEAYWSVGNFSPLVAESSLEWFLLQRPPIAL